MYQACTHCFQTNNACRFFHVDTIFSYDLEHGWDAISFLWMTHKSQAWFLEAWSPEVLYFIFRSCWLFDILPWRTIKNATVLCDPRTWFIGSENVEVRIQEEFESTDYICEEWTSIHFQEYLGIRWGNTRILCYILHDLNISSFQSYFCLVALVSWSEKCELEPAQFFWRTVDLLNKIQHFLEILN